MEQLRSRHRLWELSVWTCGRLHRSSIPRPLRVQSAAAWAVGRTLCMESGR